MATIKAVSDVATDQSQESTEPDASVSSTQGSKLAGGVAVAILVSYAALVGVMLSMATEDQPILWSRRHEIFGGVEALALAAAGFFFGREVHRARAESAEKRADAETNRKGKAERTAADVSAKLDAALREADEAAREADTANDKGRKLKSHLVTASGKGRSSDKLTLGDQNGALTLSELAVMADAFFPDESGKQR